MTNRFYIPDLKTSNSKIIISDSNTIHQITKVLRLGVGDLINIFSQKMEFELRIENIQQKFIQTSIINKINTTRQPKNKITLYQALLKKDNFEWILQKTTELGVSAIVPIITDNTIIRDISKNKRLRYEKIIIEATEQSGGINPPDLSEVRQFSEVMANLSKNNETKMIAWEGENDNKIIKFIGQKDNNYHLIIGPEGGFSSHEIEIALKNGVNPVSLGNKILRSETAAIAAVSLILLND